MFITDIRDGELPILDSDNTEALVFKSLDGTIKATITPAEPWTHDALGRLDLNEILGPNFHGEGVDAFIGTQWVGGTEV